MEISGEDARARRRDGAVLKGVVATVIVRLITSATSLVTIAILARTLHQAELGLVLTIVSIWMVVLMTTDLGIGPVLSAGIADAHGRDDVADMRRQVEVALALLAGLALLVAGVGTMAALVLPFDSWLGGHALSAATVAPAMVVAFVSAGVTLLGVVGTSVLGGVQRQAKAQTRMAIENISGVIGCSVAAWAGAPVWVFVLALLGPPAAVGVFYTYLVIWREYPELRPRRLPTARREYRGLLGSSGYVAAIRVSDGIVSGTGVIVVSAIQGPAIAAVYGVASRICLLLGSVLQAAGAQVWPSMTEAIARGDIGWVRSRYIRGVLIVGGISLAAGVVLTAVGPTAYRLLADSTDDPPLLLLFVSLAAYVLISSLNNQMAYVAAAAQRYRPLAVAWVMAAPVALGLSILLTHTTGVAGPALAAAIAYGVIVTPRIVQISLQTFRDLDPDRRSSHVASGRPRHRA